MARLCEKQTILVYKKSGLQISAASNIYNTLKYYLDVLKDPASWYEIEIRENCCIPCRQWMRQYEEDLAASAMA